MSEKATLNDHVKIFEKEMQLLFNPRISVNIIYRRDDNTKATTVNKISALTEIVCEIAGINMAEMLLSKRGEIEISDCRMIAMFYCYQYVVPNYSIIAKFFSRNHTSVIYAVETIKGRIKVKDKSILEITQELERRLSNIHGCKIKQHENEIQNQ